LANQVKKGKIDSKSADRGEKNGGGGAKGGAVVVKKKKRQTRMTHE